TRVASNRAPLTGLGVTVGDTSPGIFTHASFSSTARPRGTANFPYTTLFRSTVTMESGSTITYTVTGTVAATASGSLVNTATVTPPSGFTDSNTANNTATDTDTLSATSELSITKTTGTDSVTAWTSDTYTIVVSNSGPSTVTGATVGDTFPGIFTNDTVTTDPLPRPANARPSGNTTVTGNTTHTVTMDSLCTHPPTPKVSPLSLPDALPIYTATVTPPSGFTDSNTANNTATDTDTL